MKNNIAILFVTFSLLSMSTSGQNHQEIESTTSDVLSLNSTGSSTTVLNFLNSNAALTGGSNKRAYMSTNGNVFNLGLSNNNTGGSIEFFGQGLKRMTMNADGRLGLNATPAANTLFTVESSNLATSGHFKNSHASSFGAALYAESDNGIGVLAEGLNYGGWFESTNQNGTALYANGYSYLEGKVRIGEDPSTSDLEGQMRYNSSSKDFEGYNGTSWVSLTQKSNNNSSGETVTDIDGNVYQTVKIGNQIWMRENLRASKFNDGTIIPELTLYFEWDNLNIPAWCWYDNDNQYETLIGKLYNFNVASANNICPSGWHVPTKSEFQLLLDFIKTWTFQSAGFEGKDLMSKEPFDLLLQRENQPWQGINWTGFSSLPSGQREPIGFSFSISSAHYWASTRNSPTEGDQLLIGDNGSIFLINRPDSYGASIRCLKD